MSDLLVAIFHSRKVDIHIVSRYQVDTILSNLDHRHS